MRSACIGMNIAYLNEGVELKTIPAAQKKYKTINGTLKLKIWPSFFCTSSQLPILIPLNFQFQAVTTTSLLIKKNA